MDAFRGWIRPGPFPPGARDLPPVPPDETLDFISGHYRIFQLRDGHRFSTDDVLAAWYGTTWCPSAGTVLDLGSGIGSLAMIAAWRLPGARLVTVEAQEMSVRLARKSVAFNGLADRVDLRCADFRDPGALDVDERFDLVMGSPPYFPVARLEGDHPRRSRADSSFVATSPTTVGCRHLAPVGVFACCFRSPRTALAAAGRAGQPLAIVRHRPRPARGPAPLGLYAMPRPTALPRPSRAPGGARLVIRRPTGRTPRISGHNAGIWVSA